MLPVHYVWYSYDLFVEHPYNETLQRKSLLYNKRESTLQRKRAYSTTKESTTKESLLYNERESTLQRKRAYFTTKESLLYNEREFTLERKRVYSITKEFAPPPFGNAHASSTLCLV